MKEDNIGEWVLAIPEPYLLFWRSRCNCGRKFWTYEGYQGHYALVHILALSSSSDTK